MILRALQPLRLGHAIAVDMCLGCEDAELGRLLVESGRAAEAPPGAIATFSLISPIASWSEPSAERRGSSWILAHARHHEPDGPWKKIA